MQSIKNNDILNYCADGANTLAASVAFSYVGGSGYTSAPTIAFSGGGGTGAAATAVINNGKVIGITITNGGSGYTSAPTIAFSGGGGTGAAATAAITGDAVTSAVITNSGSAKKLTITDNTTYASGDSRSNLNILVADKFGNKVEKQISSGNTNIVVDVVVDGLDPVDGLDALVTVVSANGYNKDGSAYGIGELKTAGNFTMEA